LTSSDRTKCLIRPVSSQAELYNFVSKDGTATMSNGEAVLLSPAKYEPGLSDNSANIYYTEGWYGAVRCHQDLTCILDGSGKRLFYVKDTSGGTLELRGLVLQNGHGDYGGAVYSRNGAIIQVILCEFNSNSAGYRGGGTYIGSTTNLEFIGAAFRMNEATYGPDLCRADPSTVTIRATCPTGYASTAISGNSLSTYSDGAGSYEGPL
jgi:hypothetical protein